MSYFSLILLIALAGSCGGFASAIAQPDRHNSYKIRLPFLLDRKSGEAKLLPLGFFGNIIIGAAASISIFFVASPLFNIEPDLPSDQPSQKEIITFAKLFSLSVAAGFAGINLMEKMVDRVMGAVSDDSDQSEDDTKDATEKMIEKKIGTETQKPSQTIQKACANGENLQDSESQKAPSNRYSSNNSRSKGVNIHDEQPSKQ